MIKTLLKVFKDYSKGFRFPQYRLQNIGPMKIDKYYDIQKL